jgi:hypothetical protein
MKFIEDDGANIREFGIGEYAFGEEPLSQNLDPGAF